MFGIEMQDAFRRVLSRQSVCPPAIKYSVTCEKTLNIWPFCGPTLQTQMGHAPVASVNLFLRRGGGESSVLVTDARDNGPNWETCDGDLYGEISFPTPTSAKGGQVWGPGLFPAEAESGCVSTPAFRCTSTIPARSPPAPVYSMSTACQAEAVSLPFDCAQGRLSRTR